MIKALSSFLHRSILGIIIQHSVLLFRVSNAPKRLPGYIRPYYPLQSTRKRGKAFERQERKMSFNKQFIQCKEGEKKKLIPKDTTVLQIYGFPKTTTSRFVARKVATNGDAG